MCIYGFQVGTFARSENNCGWSVIQVVRQNKKVTD